MSKLRSAAVLREENVIRRQKAKLDYILAHQKELDEDLERATNFIESAQINGQSSVTVCPGFHEVTVKELEDAGYKVTFINNQGKSLPNGKVKPDEHYINWV